MRLNRLIVQAFDEIKALAKSGAEALESVKSAIWKKIEEIDKRFEDRKNEVDSRFFTREEEVDKHLLANSISILRTIRTQLQIQDEMRSYIDSQNSIQNEIADERYGVTLANSISNFKGLIQQGSYRWGDTFNPNRLAAYQQEAVGFKPRNFPGKKRA